MVKSVIFILVVFATIINSFSQNQAGDYDFVVTVLDNFKKPINNLEVRLKDEEEILISKKLTLNDGTIEFRSLLKNKSYHLEFEKSNEKLKNADKIYIKDIVKTEEIVKAETGFDYYVFVGDNVSFSEIGIRDPRPDTPEEVVQNSTSTLASNETKISENNISNNVVTNNEIKNTETSNTVVANSTANENNNTTEPKIDNSKVTSSEPVNEAVAETKKQDASTNIGVASITKSNNSNTSQAVSENSKVTDVEQVNKNNSQSNNNEVVNTSNSQYASSSENNTAQSKNQKISESNNENKFSTDKKADESSDLASQNKTTKNETINTNELIDFSQLKDKDFNNPETHELLIVEENKIKIKKINYKVQIGAYTHQEVASKIRVSGFKIETQTYPDGFTRLTIGNCNSLKEAEALRKKLIAKGMKDSWILGFYENKRYTMKDLATNNFFQ
jgi:hypothetical protein